MSSLQSLSLCAADPVIDTQASIHSHTIKVDDSYTLDAGDTLHLKGNIGFKLLLKNGAPVDLTIDGSVLMDTDQHHNLGGVVSTHSINGEVHVGVGEAGSLSVQSNTPGAGSVYGVNLQANTITVENAGQISVGGGLASLTAGLYLSGLDGDVQVENIGSIGVLSSGARAYGIAAGGGDVDVSSLGHISVQAVAEATGIFADASTGGSLELGGTIEVTSAAAIGVLVAGEMTSVTNAAEITVFYRDPDSGAPKFTAGLLVNGGPLGGSLEGPAVVDNSGGIHVHGSDAPAVGVDIQGAASFHNSGTIDAASDAFGALPYYSAGLVLKLDAGGVATNDGSITGQQYAILSGDLSSPGSIAAADDIVVNNGWLSGFVALGGGNDSFDGHLGASNGGVYGGEGNDTLIGGASAEALSGDEGNDVLTGGGGADVLIGGDGVDIFRFAAVSDSVAGNADLITDLTSADRISLGAIDADTGTHGHQDFVLVGAFSGHAGELTVSYDSGADLTTIAGDTDGDGTADLVITASGDHHDFTSFTL